LSRANVTASVIYLANWPPLPAGNGAHTGWPGPDFKVLLRPYPAEDMTCYRVSPLVNNARNDSPECIKPA
jgi:hypothetical protein